MAVIAVVLLQTAAAPHAVGEPRPAHFVDRGGPVLHAAQIYLMYWGTAWTRTGTSSPTPDQITAEFRWVVTGPYLTGLAEYRGIQPAALRAATVVPTSDPHRGFDDHAVRDFLDTQLDTDVVPEPGADNQTLYFVLFPPGVSSGGGSSEFNGEHFYFTRNHRRIHFAWTVDSGNLAAATQVMSHELVDSVTDPEGTPPSPVSRDPARAMGGARSPTSATTPATSTVQRSRRTGRNALERVSNLAWPARRRRRPV